MVILVGLCLVVVREDINMKSKINYIGMIFIILSSMIIGLLMINVPETINQINNLNTNSIYGHWASYMIGCLIFYLLIFKVNIIQEDIK